METVLSLCIGIGLSAACGFRVFVPVLVVILVLIMLLWILRWFKRRKALQA